MIYRHKSNSNKLNNFSLHKSLPKHLSTFEEKKKIVIEKFLLKFDKFHHKSYEIGKLVKVLNFFFDNTEVVENFNLEKDFHNYERMVCERLNIKPVSETSVQPENIHTTISPIRNSSVNILSKDCSNSFDHNDLKTLLTSNNSYREINEFIPFKRKIDKIKLKEEDEWAKIALVKSLELNEDIKKKREKEEDRRKKIREELAQQIIFKKQRINSEKKDEGIFAKIQSHKNEILDKITQDKKENNKKEMIKALEISENLYKMKKQKEIEEINRINKQDKLNLEKVRNEDEKERNKLFFKKLSEKNLFKENLIETELSKKRRQELKEKDRQIDMQYLGYNYFVNDRNCRPGHQNNERLSESPEKIDLIHKNSSVRSKIQEFESTKEIQKYLKDFEENNEKLNKYDSDKKTRKEKEIKEIKDVLARQVIEKKIRNEEGEKINKKYHDILKNDVEKYKQQNELQQKAVKDKYMKYKIELKNQIDDRFNFKEKFITDDELKLNKHILSKINNPSDKNT